MATLTDAIINLSSGTAEVGIVNEDIDNIEWLNGTTPIAKADILAKQIELTGAEATAVTQKATDKASGNTKLLALGLTQAEVDAITK
tara:strand:+ start:694 stop:954 length:261 start_codon:yes stop_codon:yes gene_type:complete